MTLAELIEVAHAEIPRLHLNTLDGLLAAEEGREMDETDLAQLAVLIAVARPDELIDWTQSVPSLLAVLATSASDASVSEILQARDHDRKTLILRDELESMSPSGVLAYADKVTFGGTPVM